MSMNRRYSGIDELPQEISVFPLSGALLLPRCELPLNIFEPRYMDMIDAVLAGDRIIGMIQPMDAAEGDQVPRLYAVGCAGRLTRFSETGDGRYIISLEGVCRFGVERETTTSTPFRRCAVSFARFAGDLVAPQTQGVDRAAVMAALRAYASENALSVDWDLIRAATDETLVNALAMMSPFGVREKQALLEAASLQARAEMLVAITEFDLAARDRPGSPLN